MAVVGSLDLSVNFLPIAMVCVLHLKIICPRTVSNAQYVVDM